MLYVFLVDTGDPKESKTNDGYYIARVEPEYVAELIANWKAKGWDYCYLGSNSAPTAGRTQAVWAGGLLGGYQSGHYR